MTTVTRSTTIAQPAIVDAGGLDLAYDWGKEDGLNGDPCRPGLYFPLDTPAYDAYNAGYQAGVNQGQALAGKVVIANDGAA